MLEPYRSKELFCDRETETERIIECLENGRNVTLISPRRLGKTGLIYRVFDALKDKGAEYDTFYADISSSQSLEDFIKIVSDSVAGILKKRDLTDFFKALGGIRPLLSIDPLTGKPELSFTYRVEEDKTQTLKSLLSYLENSKKKVILAIDEFQQIREYPGVNMEAVLRSHIQCMHNVRFIFSGSRKHLMTDMFTNAKRPFYESTSNVPVGKLDPEVYSEFIGKLFKERGKTISEDIIEDIISWTLDYTYYTQALCNEVFMQSGGKVTDEVVRQSKVSVLSSNIDKFLEIKRLVTPAQWKLMKAVAKESEVRQPTGAAFIQKYGLSSGAAVLKNIKSLVEKELILPTTALDGTSYCIYNIFLGRYLERL